MDRRQFVSTLALATLLSGCAMAGTGAGLRGSRVAVPAGNAYFGLGNEPSWTVEITDEFINFHDANRRQIRVPNPGARPSINGERYVTEQLTVDISHGACSDGMSDRRYADSVLVSANGRDYRGCGGQVLPPNDLNNSQWRIISIDGQALPPSPAGNERRAAEMRFADGRISANVGCNQLNGAYTADARRLTVTQLSSTRMACLEPAVQQREQRIRELLGQSLALRFNGRGSMVLTGNGGAEIVLERVI